MASLPQEYLDSVLAQIDGHALLELINYRTDKIESIGADQWRGFCPIHKETIFRTLVIDNINKTYECTYNFCAGHQGGDLIDLYAKALNLTPEQAVADLIDQMHLPIKPPSVAPNPNKSLEVARNLLELNANDEAIDAFRSILAVEAFHVEAHEGLAQAYSRKGDVDAAASELEVLLSIHQNNTDNAQIVRVAARLIQLFPREPDHYYTIIEALDRMHDDASLIEYQQQLVTLLDELGRSDDATDLRIELEDRGIVSLESSLKIIEGLLAKDRLDEAREKAMFRIRRFEEREDDEAANALIMLMIERGIADAAMRKDFYEQVARIGLSPDQLQRCLAGAQRMIDDEEFDEAEELLDGIERRARGNLSFLQTRSRLAAARGNTEGADDLRYQIIDRLLHDDRHDEAAAQLDEILAANPDEINALQRQVDLFERLDDEERAIEVCWQIVDELKKQDRTDELVPVYERLTYFDGDNAGLRQEFIFALADAGRRREASLAAIMFGEELIEQGRTVEAIQRLTDISDRVKTSPEILVKIAELKLEEDDKEEAAALFARASEARMKEKRLPESLLLLRRAIDTAPNEPAYLEKLADALVGADRNEEAIEVYKRLAEVLLDRDETQSAEHVMEKVFALSPEDTSSLRVMARIFGSKQEEGREIDTLSRLGRLCLSKREYGRCLDIADEILRLDPDSIAALELKIDALEKSNRQSQAISTCFELADTLLERGQAEKAEPLLRRVLELDPTTIKAREKLVDILLKDQRHDEAVELGVELLSAYRRAQRFDEATRLVATLTDIAPSDHALRQTAFEIYRDAGDSAAATAQANSLIAIHREAGDHDKAAALFRTMLETSPDDLDLRMNFVALLQEQDPDRELPVQGLRVARLLRQHDRADDAVRFYEAVVTADENNEAAALELAELHSELGNPGAATAIFGKMVDRLRDADDIPAAASILQKAVRADKRNPSLRRLLIDLALEEQHIDEAIAGYIHLYELYRSQEQHQKALETIDEAIGVKPDNVALRRYRADELRALGRETEADRAEIDLVDLYAKNGEIQLAEDLLATLSHREDPPAGLEKARERLRKLRADRDSDAIEPDEAMEREGRRRGSKPLRRISDEEASGSGEMRRLGPGRDPVRLSLVEDYIFDNFVVGDENQFAYATSLAVSKSPGKQYNPLFIYGDVGMGKTHLANAIGLAISHSHPDRTVTYTGTDEFVQHLVEAIQNNAVSAFRDAYRATDVLLIDDIQFLSGKDRAQEEFFHVFNALFQASKQIVLTSDRPPKDIAHLEDRLTTRFGAGVIVEIRPPGIETRMAIVRAEMSRREIEADGRVLETIANRLDGSVRELKGAVNQLCALVEISGKALTVESAKRAIEAVYARSANKTQF